MKLNNIPIGQLAMEFISVVFAVLLALGLNSYKQSIDINEEAEIIKASILKECHQNKAKIDSMLIANQSYASYLDSLVSLDPDEVNNVTFKYNLELLTDAAWVIAQNNSAINKLDQEFLINVAEIYQTQIFFTEFSRSFFENLGSFVIKQDENPPYSTALALYFNVNIINNSCSELLNTYQDLFDKYETTTE